MARRRGRRRDGRPARVAAEATAEAAVSELVTRALLAPLRVLGRLALRALDAADGL